MNKQQLASKIWETANNLRSKIKANEYKDYILGFMFYKYLYDNEERYVQSLGGTIEDLKDDSAKSMIQTGIGYFISYDNLFSVWKNKGNSLGAGTVSEALTEFNRNINPTYKKVFDNIFSTLQGGLSKLGDSSGSRDKAVRDIVDLINDIPTTNSSYDVLGYIYEYLIFKFSTAAKDDGAFYTPHEVSSLIARIVADAMKDKKELNVYDPTSGSGSLLLNIGKEASKYIDSDNIKYFGQEKITETYHLTRMNLIMKGVGVSNIFVRNGDTLENDWPYFDEETSYEPLMVDAVVSNPPYSLKWEPDTRENDPRFKYGLAPSSKADYAFLLHCLFHLKKDGVMAIVLPHGVLFRGASEGVIRKNLIDNDHIETIIGLPANLFYATGIPTIIMILRKNRTGKDVLFIDASQNYGKEKTQNVLRESDIQRIFDVVKDRKSVDNFSRLVEKSEIIANEYNLNIPRYVSATTESEGFDLYSLMSGAVSNDELSKFNEFWTRFPELKNNLFSSSNGYNTFNNVDIKETILKDEHIKEFKSNYAVLSDNYKEYLITTLIKGCMTTGKYTSDKVVDKLFEIIGAETLVDKYSVYQTLAEKWNEIENDLITIRENGIEVCKKTEPFMVFKKDAKTKKTYEVQNGWKGIIIPFDLVQKRFFDKDFEKMRELEFEAESYASEYSDTFENLDEDFKKEVSKEDGTTFDNKKLKDKIKDASTPDDIKETLKSALAAKDKESALRKEIKTIYESLEDKTKEKIERLTDDEVELILIEKWITPIINDMNNICNNTITTFINGIEGIKNKYSNNLAEINEEIHKADEELFALMDELVGNETDMLAIQMLKDALK